MKPAPESPPAPSKAPSCLGKPIRNLARLPLQVGSRRKKSGRSQKLAFSPKTSRFSPLILAQKGSALSWLVDDRAVLHPRRILCLLIQQYVQYHACACCGSIRLSTKGTPASRVPHAPDGHHFGFRRNSPHTAKPPPLVNQPAGSGGQPVGVRSRG